MDIPEASAVQGISSNPGRGLNLGLLLGTDYEKKKQRLLQELQLDCRNFVTMKRDVKNSDPDPQPQGLSLPIDERIGVQEIMREERNREYNQFLRQQVQIKRLKRGTPPVTSKPEHVQASDPASSSVLGSHISAASRRDAATLTEAFDNGIRTGSWGLSHRRWSRPCRLKECDSSEEELSSDREEEPRFRNRRRQDGCAPEPEPNEGRRTRTRRIKRAPHFQSREETEAPADHDHNNGWVEKPDLGTADSVRTAARSRSGTDRVEFATGLMIGTAEEQAASHIKKEQYRQELLKQIGEQQRNKIKEKKLELGVAATGATDREKEADRIIQLGTVNRQYDGERRDVSYKLGRDFETVAEDPNPGQKNDPAAEHIEQKTPSAESHVDYSTAPGRRTGMAGPASERKEEQGVPWLDYVNEDYYKEFSNMLSDVAIPRVATGPPPVPPTVTNTFKTPYDAAYYYYGARNPFDPPYSQNGLPGGSQQLRSFISPCQRPPPLETSGCTKASDQRRLSPVFVGEAPVDRAKQRRESALSHQEALREQIKGRDERKKREKEEQERYNAKIEAEMMAYSPWGKSGGGAPIRDQKGNLVNDLNQMHRTNEESYRNPVFRSSGQTQNHGHQLSGFNNQTTPQQRHTQYKEDLRQQMEENKRKKDEERERLRIEEEKEEKRVTYQRVCMQQEYEEEKREQKRHSPNQSWIQPKIQPQKEEKKARQDQEAEKKLPRSARTKEEESEQLSYERGQSPPIPTLLHRKQTHLVAFRPSTAERSVSVPNRQPVPVKTPLLRDGVQMEVIRQLSTTSRCLREKQRQLEAQMDQADPQESRWAPPDRPRGRARMDAFESAHKQAARSSTRSRNSAVNMQTIREFIKLKHRDTPSLEEARQLHPDQQQALLPEQPHDIRLEKRQREHDVLDQPPSLCRARSKSGRICGPMLPCDTAFIDVYSGDGACGEHEQKPCQPSAEHQERRGDHMMFFHLTSARELDVATNRGNCEIEPDAQSWRDRSAIRPRDLQTHIVTRQ